MHTPLRSTHLLLLLGLCFLFLPWATLPAAAQNTQDAVTGSQGSQPQDRRQEIEALRAELARISARLDALESSNGTAGPISTAAAGPPVSSASTAGAAPRAGIDSEGASAPPHTGASVSAVALSPAAAKANASQTAETAAAEPAPDFFHSTSINLNFDGYYGYNFNQPVGGVNLLRAYDVTSNSFNINQVDLVLERLPTTRSPFGGRLDLMWGQATETLQGSAANEQRPQVWRNVFQAYGSYLAPIGTGLQMDFGKFASSLGSEGNYTKDQIAYSRGYLFYYLPFYHMGLRANYNVTPKVNVAYWLVNGAQQTEDLNGFKSQAFLFTLKPASSVSWNVNYYFGEEGRAVAPNLYPGVPPSPAQPGLPLANLSPTPNGREHIFDTWSSWQATQKLKLVGEADFVVNRSFAEQQPGRVALGALEFQYALPHSSNLGGRAEYLDDRGGLFSGKTQALKEVTFVADHLFAPGFLVRAEYRRDFSNQRFFLTDTAGSLVTAQTTATLGLVYWWGTKQGGW